MRINSINTITSQRQNKNQVSAFGHRAVPYPEYENAYYNNSNGIIASFTDKLASLFNPEVKKEAEQIKSQINGLYENKDSVQGKKKLSYYA